MKTRNEKIVAIIPARGGSKSIPRKNIKLLGGYPLISYSITAALCSDFIDRVIVSTDDAEIAEIAKQWGAEVPFIRPIELANDYVTDYPVFYHAMSWLEENQNYRANIVVQLRPTSPFRPSQSVDEAISLLLDSDADSVRAVTSAGQNPYKMWRIQENKLIPLLHSEFNEPYNMPRQKLPPTYWQTGHIEVIRYDTIFKKFSMTGDFILPYILSPQYAIDLDTPLQWEFAEFLIQHGNFDINFPGDYFFDARKYSYSFSYRD